MKKHNFTYFLTKTPLARAILGNEYLIPGCIYQTVEETALYERLAQTSNIFWSPKKVVIPQNQIIMCTQNIPINKMPGNEKSLNTEPYFEFLWQEQLLSVVNGSYSLNQKLMIL